MKLRLTKATFASVLLAGLPAAKADTFNWLGNSSIWSDLNQWTELAAPPSAATTDLIFGGAGGYTATDDVAGTFLLNSITLNAATASTIAGNALSLVTDGAETPGITQNGAGAFAIGNAISATNALTFTGAGTGLVTLNGVLSGGGGIAFTGANWRLTNTANTFTGTMNIGAGSFVEMAPAGALSFAPGAAALMGNAALTINGGTLKLTTAAGAAITLGGARPVVFGAAGGTLDITNSVAGNITTGDLALTLNNSAGNVAVVKFNGGVNGLSTNSVTDGNWDAGANALRFNAITNPGALRLELTNGAMARSSLASVAQAITIRGVVGGDPTSGPLGTVNTGISRTTGRLAVTAESNYTSLTFQGAMQVGAISQARALTGGIVVAGTLSGNPGYVDFTGRGTGTQLSSALNDPGVGTAGQNPLWLLRNASGSLTIQDGGIAAFDVRLRSDTSGRNGNGVALDGPAFIEGGGQLKVHQSVSNFTTGVASTIANVGDVIVFGDITGTGSTAREAVFSIALPAPQAGTTIVSTIPFTLTEIATADSQRPYGGLRFDDSRGVADFIVNGSGFGGLRIEGIARPNELLSADGTTAGAPIADPVTALTKVNSVLTDARLSRLSGSGGYLTIAPTGFTYALNPGAVWANANVGLRVADHNAGGTDVSLGTLSSWSKNFAIDAGATLDLGAQTPFTFFGPGVLHGKGSITGTGSVLVDTAGSISPGLGDIGTLTIGAPLTLGGGLSIGVNNTTADLLAVTGALALGGPLALSGTFGTSDLIIASYTGALSGAFSGITGLDPDFVVDYGTLNNSIISLKYAAAVTRTWNGNVSGAWNTTTANWQGGGIFASGDKVVFDDTAAGNFTVTVSGGDVTPALLTVNNASNAYTLISSAGNAITGSAKLVKNNNGILTLTGPATFNGGIEVNGGELQIGASDSLPDIGAVTVGAAGTLNTQGNSDTIADLVVNGAVTGGGTLSVASLALGSGAAFAPSVVLGGNVTKTGAASSTLAGAVDLGGVARIFDVAAGGGSDLTLNGVISAGALIKTGAGTLVLGNGGNLFSGGVTVNGGTLRAGAAGAIPAGSNATTGAGGVLDLNGSAHALGTLNNSGITATGGAALSVTSLTGVAPGAIQMGGGALTLNIASGTSTYGGGITGAGATLIKNGAGTQVLGGNATYDGGTTINGGILALNTGTAAGAGAISVQAAGALQLGAGIANVVNLDGGRVGSNGGERIITGVVNANAPSTLQSYTDDNLIIEGAGGLQGSADINTLPPPGDGSADNGGGIRLRSTVATNYSGTITVGNVVKFELQTSVAGPFSPAGTGIIRMTGGTFTGGLNGTYSGLNLRNNSTGNTVLGNNVEIIGTGIASFNPVGSAPATARITMGNLKIGANQTAAANRNGTAGVTAFVVGFSSVSLQGGNATFSPNTLGSGYSSTTDIALGPIGESAAGSGIIMDGQAKLLMEGVNTYTGPTLLNRGTTILGAAASIASSPDVTVAPGATLDVNALPALIVPITQTLTVNGTLSGAVALEGTLRGSGNITGGVTTSGALIEPGNSAGILAVAALTLDSTSELSIEFGKLNLGTPIAGTDYDQVSTFDITLGGAQLTGTRLNEGLETGDILTIVLNNGANPVGGTFAGVANASTVILDGAQFTISYFDDAATGAFETTGGNDVSLQFIIPEPATATLLLGGLALLTARRRRK